MYTPTLPTAALFTAATSLLSFSQSLPAAPKAEATPTASQPPSPPAFLLATTRGVGSSKVQGAPEAPAPYRVEAALPEHPIHRLITLRFEPGSGRLIYVHQPPSAKNTHLMRYDLQSRTVEKLLDIDEFIYGIEFHPEYAKNGYIYLGTNGPTSSPTPERRALVVRYTIPRTGTEPIDPKSASEVIQWPSNGHNGTALAFGSDGMLYITSGDGTADSDTHLAGQRLDHLLAKVLRLDVDHPEPGKPYAVPPDNPFLNRPGVRAETWAYGLRNPWRASWDPTLQRLWVGQNGQDRLEQIYLIQKGANYGWSVYEGSQPFYLNRPQGPDPVAPPTLEHQHHESRSLTGGAIYTGSVLPELRGAYVYGDYATGKIWAARHDGTQITWHQKIAESRLGLTDFITSPQGELWLANYQSNETGGVYRLAPNPPATPTEPFPKKLSETGLFESVESYNLVNALLPFSVIIPEWGDGALIRRHLGMPPEGGKIGFSARRGWDFPDKTVILQSFFLPDPVQQNAPARRMETRLLTRQKGEWAGYSYKWNREQTDAVLVEEEGAEALLEGGRVWRFPSRAECAACHNRSANYLLGLQTAQMNRTHDYGEGFSGNQLEVLSALGLFTNAGKAQNAPFVFTPALANQDKLADPWDASLALSERAESYLHATCSHCHVESGGGNSQMDLRTKTPPEKMKIFNEIPNHGTLGLSEDSRLVVPGDAAKSVLLARVARSNEGRMPPLGSASPDARAVRLLYEWITSLQKAPESPVPPAPK